MAVYVLTLDVLSPCILAFLLAWGHQSSGCAARKREWFFGHRCFWCAATKITHSSVNFCLNFIRMDIVDTQRAGAYRAPCGPFHPPPHHYFKNLLTHTRAITAADRWILPER